MRIPRSLSLLIRTVRRELGLSQKELACRAGISQSRLCHIESGRRSPGRSELEGLCAGLELSTDQVIRETRWELPRRGRPSRVVEREVERLFGFERPYALIGERDFARRLAACQLQFPQAFGRLQRALDARADRARVERFLVGFPCGSGHECLFDLCLLALNALPARLSPLRLGFADPRLQDPATRRYVGHCLMPSLVLYRPSLTEVYWPQVPVRTERQPYTLDFLVALHDGRNQVWLNVEVDGPGHEGSGDEDRARQIRLPTMRLRSETLLRPDFPCWLDDRLRQLLLGHGRPHLRRLRRWP